jgi:lysosomal alpha-mannosidase
VQGQELHGKSVSALFIATITLKSHKKKNCSLKDPFGHSKEQASLFAQFGFDGLFLGRIDYQDFENRGKLKTREMLWQASENLGKSAELFTGILPNVYWPPEGFCFDIICGVPSLVDDPESASYNIDDKVNTFLEYVFNQSTEYKTNNLIMTMGSDFQYSYAESWFKNLDKLIINVNKLQETNNSKVNIFYSTTACYLYSLYMANVSWPTKNDDFFPYANKPHTFWTGYFTSRPALKKYVRQTNNFLQAIRHLIAFANLDEFQVNFSLSTLERYF